MTLWFTGHCPIDKSHTSQGRAHILKLTFEASCALPSLFSSNLACCCPCLQPHCSCLCFPRAGTLPPWGFCPDRVLCPDSYAPGSFMMASSLTSFKSLLKCHLLNKTNQSIPVEITMHSSFCPSLPGSPYPALLFDKGINIKRLLPSNTHTHIHT